MRKLGTRGLLAFVGDLQKRRVVRDSIWPYSRGVGYGVLVVGYFENPQLEPLKQIVSSRRYAEAFEQRKDHLAHQPLRESTEREEENVLDQKPTRTEISRIMSVMGRKGGKKSAKARMEKITPHERSRIVLKAAQARWAKKDQEKST